MITFVPVEKYVLVFGDLDRVYGVVNRKDAKRIIEWVPEEGGSIDFDNGFCCISLYGGVFDLKIFNDSYYFNNFGTFIETLKRFVGGA